MSKRRILLIDDERDFTEVVKFNLEKEGEFEVHIENRSVDAVASALRVKPHLILLDVIMPEKEGPDVYRQLRSHPGLQKTPVVFFTATITREETRREGGEVGGHIFLAKPSSMDELLHCVRHQLNYVQPD